MIKTIFIVNPNSGNGYGLKIGKKIEEIIGQIDDECEVLYTSKPNDATIMAARYIKTDNVQIISVGGDGTLNEVLNGIREGVTLGVIPSGSGNDFYRMIDPNISDLKELIISTIHGERKLIDYGLINGKKFLSSFSVGIDAAVVRESRLVQEKNANVRKSAYLRSILNVIMKQKGFSGLLEEKSVTMKQDFLLISALNGKCYGGGFKAAPYASLDDGLVDVCIVDNIKLPRIVNLLPKYLQGKHYGKENVTTLSTNQLSITTPIPSIAQCDGEVFYSCSFKLQVVHEGLSLLIPKK